MFFVTDFADAAVILPVALTVAVLLALLDWRRGALGWSAGVLAALAAVLLGKLALFACSGGSHALLRSPSGHTASAAVVYGGALALPASRLVARSRGWAWSSLILAALFGGLAAVVIGASRLLLGVHSVDDVLTGGGCGVIGLWLMLWLAGPMPPRLVRRQPLTAALGTMLIGAIVLLLHGERLPIEPMLHGVGLRLHGLVPQCGG